MSLQAGSAVYTETSYEHIQANRGVTRIKNRQDVFSRKHKVHQTMTAAFNMLLVGISVNSGHYWLEN